MVYFGATEAKNQFGRVLDTAQRETVSIEKNGRSYAVVLSNDEYERLTKLEDTFWGLKAELALSKEDFYSEEESEALLNEFLNA